MNATRYALAATLYAGALAYIALRGNASALLLLGLLPYLILLSLCLVVASFGVGLLYAAAPLYTVTATLPGLLAPIAIAGLGYLALPAKPIFGRLLMPTVATVRNTSAYVAVVLSLGYPMLRIGWLVGIPSPLPSELRPEVGGIVLYGVLFTVGGLLSAVYTWGLTRPWGASFASGRPVPIGLSRNSAVLFGVVVLSAGAYFVRSVIRDETPIPIAQGDIKIIGSRNDGPLAPDIHDASIGAWLPEMFLPIWGIALIIAGLAYAEFRRRTDELADMRVAP
ncbi:hypothetical protein EK0264_12665 [Epidermidibacterium keratini]|uniref:Uncharacterized protein n=1 Tax=Epidermidibacterium keratini TaxID=1891644 RepID=A0A7L4YQJ4_9ACTN|nr:hypothetical protein [Epidermidibacterium keratini]QHC01059.1 hypothetical protein EK0264_12665 [Epidermidibacterium keratini]